MHIVDYHTTGGKNLIKEYLSDLPKKERDIGYHIRHEIVKEGIAALKKLDIRQLRGDLWEIKFFDSNRVMYVVMTEQDKIYFLHICKKQKGKAEKFEIETALERKKEFAL
jgi:phage-related protein